MQFKKVKINPKIRHENIPCTSAYFEKNFLNQELAVVFYGTNYIRIRDSEGEEWGFFEQEYIPCG